MKVVINGRAAVLTDFKTEVGKYVFTVLEKAEYYGATCYIQSEIRGGDNPHSRWHAIDVTFHPYWVTPIMAGILRIVLMRVRIFLSTYNKHIHIDSEVAKGGGKYEVLSTAGNIEYPITSGGVPKSLTYNSAVNKISIMDTISKDLGCAAAHLYDPLQEVPGGTWYKKWGDSLRKSYYSSFGITESDFVDYQSKKGFKTSTGEKIVTAGKEVVEDVKKVGFKTSILLIIAAIIAVILMFARKK